MRTWRIWIVQNKGLIQNGKKSGVTFKSKSSEKMTSVLVFYLEFLRRTLFIYLFIYILVANLQFIIYLCQKLFSINTFKQKLYMFLAFLYFIDTIELENSNFVEKLYSNISLIAQVDRTGNRRENEMNISKLMVNYQHKISEILAFS